MMERWMIQMKKNKLLGLLCVALGVLSVLFNDGDATFMLLALLFGGGIFVCGEECFEEDAEV